MNWTHLGHRYAHTLHRAPPPSSLVCNLSAGDTDERLLCAERAGTKETLGLFCFQDK